MKWVRVAGKPRELQASVVPAGMVDLDDAVACERGRGCEGGLAVPGEDGHGTARSADGFVNRFHAVFGFEVLECFARVRLDRGEHSEELTAPA